MNLFFHGAVRSRADKYESDASLSLFSNGKSRGSNRMRCTKPYVLCWPTIRILKYLICKHSSLLECYAMSIGKRLRMFRVIVVPSSSGLSSSRQVGLL
jgi:hypothetical protein